MALYKYRAGGVIRLADGALIPEDVSNADWREYCEWVTAGGVTAPEVTAEEQAQQQEAAERAWRDSELNATQWPVARHRDELDAGTATTLSADQFAELLAYRQALRDWPAAKAFPDSDARPVAPAWLAAALAA